MALDETKFKYLLLPLDEEVFEINANARTITVPPNFKKYGVSIQGDEIAETLLFKIDRFFDYMDLDMTDIYVQWTNPLKEEGASKIIMRDSESEPGKILFGWPLTSKITKVAGPLKFSVRFFKRDSETQSVTYSFNTQTQVVTVHPALQPELNSEASVDDASELFAQAIKNSPSSVGTPAKEPYFTTPGTDLPKQAYLENNVLSLSVQAITEDTGVISYKWYYQKLQEDGTVKTVEIVPKNDYRPTTDTSRNPKKIYYVEESTAPTAHSIYTGEIPNENVTIKERFSTYEILDGEDQVIGTYYVEAENRAGRSSSYKKSTYCEVPGPKELSFTTDLNPTTFIEDTGVTLTVATKTDNERIDVGYIWKMSSESDTAEKTVIEGKTGASLVVDSTAPGWYQVTAVGTLNRATLETESVICKVTEHPVAPVILSPVEDTTIDAVAGTNVELVVTVEDLGGALKSDKVEYVWMFGKPDEEPEVLAEEDEKIVSGFGTNKLIVKSATDGSTHFYYCVVKNILSGETKETTSKLFVIY